MTQARTRTERSEPWPCYGRDEQKSDAQIFREKRREFKRLQQAWERFWLGSGHLNPDVSRAINEFQGAVTVHFQVLSGHFGVVTNRMLREQYRAPQSPKTEREECE